MNIKSTLKTIKLNESTISMFLGAIVIIVVGVLVINYFKASDSGETIPPVDTENLGKVSLPTTHTIGEGEDLWSISERYYGTGYNWVDIASENNLTDPDEIRVGQLLTIPNVSARLTEGEEDEPEVTASNDVEATEDSTEAEIDISEEPRQIDPSGSSYTVQSGDSLWKIAEQVYGDGYKWVEIANKNNLSNPDVIHPGNVFTLPN